MRPITIAACSRSGGSAKPTIALHAFAAAVLTALAASSAAAAGYLKLGDIKGQVASASEGGKEKWIEIQGWDWGRVAKVDGFAVKQGVQPGAKGGNVEFEWKVEEGESAPPPPAGGQEKITVDGNRTESGQATGKRQHMPIRARTYYDQGTQPLDRGAVRVKVKFPWVGCAVGARYPVITLGDAANSYRLQDVTVASCGSAAGGNDGPEESITFVYGKLGAKVRVRAWDPAKKEE